MVIVRAHHASNPYLEHSLHTQYLPIIRHIHVAAFMVEDHQIIFLDLVVSHPIRAPG